MNARNYWLRLIGANLLASIVGPDLEPFWLDLLVYALVVLSLMLLTSPAERVA